MVKQNGHELFENNLQLLQSNQADFSGQLSRYTPTIITDECVPRDTLTANSGLTVKQLKPWERFLTN